MRHLFTAALIGLASPAFAAGWYFEASVEGGAEYWTFTNETGEVSPQRVRGNEIWITRTDQMNELDANGTCDFNNCRVSVTLDGRDADGILHGLLKPLLLLVGTAAGLAGTFDGNFCVFLRLQPLLFGLPRCPVQTAAARPRPGLIVLRADLGMIAILPRAHDPLVAARR